ncbi:MAG: proton-conducting transporter membrane subunit, partial [Desulfobacteraceae bacterium]|nr:proton-conducting transporter membrane subunit [Desulfobacteraceae bacterium]
MSYLFLSVSIVLCGGILPFLFIRQFNRMRAVAAFFTATGCLLGLVSAVLLLAGNDQPTISVGFLSSFTLDFKADGLSAFFLMVIFLISFLAAIYGYHYLDKPERAVRIAASHLFFSLLIAAMALVVTAYNIITFLLCWEIMSLASFFLVVHDHEIEENSKAGYLYAVYSQVGALFLLAAFGIMYASTGTLDFAAAASLSEPTKILVFALAFVGFGSKAGVFPFHAWLPHAHPAAPSHISALMSGVMIKTGVYGIVRLYHLLAWHTPLFGQIVIIAGMITGILGVIYALGQQDIKRMLAYSSVENIGIILIALGLGMIGVAAGQPLIAVLGFAGGFLHVLNHSLFKSLLFMGAGMVLHQTGTRAMDQLGGLIKRMPVTGSTFLIGSLAIAGLPPFNGFVSEFLIYMGGFRGAALGKSYFVLSVLAIISLALIGGLALAAFTKVNGVVFQGEPRGVPAQNAAEHGSGMLVPMVILAAACLIVGLFPTFFMALAIRAVAALNLGYGRIPLAPFVPLTANITRAAALFLGVLVLLWILRSFCYRGKTITQAGTWGCGFTRPTARMQYTSSSFAASILNFFSTVAPLKEEHPAIKGRFPAPTHYHSQIQDIAELQITSLIVRPVIFLFDKLRWLQHG